MKITPQLYINGNLVDTDKKTVIAITFQVNDIAEIKDRNVNYTNTIKIPKTSNNVHLFQLLGITGNLSLIPYDEVSVRLVSGAVEVVTNGLMLVQDTSGDYYRIVILDGITTLKQALDGKTLQDLDFSDINHIMNIANIVNSYSPAVLYEYPVADFEVGLISTEQTKHLYNTLLPCAYLHDVFDRIFTESGFEYEGEVFSVTKFLETLIPITGKIQVEHEISAEFSEVYDAINPLTYQVFGVAGGGAPTPIDIDVNYENLLIQEQITHDTSSTQTVYSVTEDIQLIIKLFVQVDGWSYTLGDEVDYKFKLKVNGVEVDDLININNSDLTGIMPPLTFEAEVVANVEAGDNIAVYCKSNRFTTSGGFIYCSQVKVDAIENTEARETHGSTINFSRQLPPVDQYEIIKIFMQQYGLVAVPVSDTKIKFAHIKDIFTQFYGVVDWSDKLVSEKKEVYTLGAYGKSNYLKYKYNNKEDSGFADHALLFDVHNLPATKTLFESNVIMVKHETAKDTLIVPKIEFIEEELYEDDEGTERRRLKYKADDKLYFIRSLEHTLNNGFTLQEVSTVISDGFINEDAFVAGSSDLRFGDVETLYFEQLAQDYYEEFRLVNERAQKKTVKVLLNILDIQALDFCKLVYFKQFGSFFYLNKLKNWRDMSLAEAEVVRIKLTTNLIGCADSVAIINQEFEGDSVIGSDWFIENGSPYQVASDPFVIESAINAFFLRQNLDQDIFEAGANDYRVRFKAVRRKNEPTVTELQVKINSVVIVATSDEVIIVDDTFSIIQLATNWIRIASSLTGSGVHSYEVHYIEICKV